MSILEKYELAFQVSPVPLLLVSSHGEIILANDDFSALFEYDPGELIGLNVDRLVPAAQRAQHGHLRTTYHAAPSKRSMGAGRDLFGVTKTGTIIPLELGLEPVKNGQDHMALVAAIDIRHRKVHEALMQRAIDAAASAMVMVDDHGQIVFVNKAAVKLFGYREDQLLYHPIKLLVPDEFKDAHFAHMQKFQSAPATRLMGRGRDLWARRCDGSKVPVEITLTPVDTPTGQLVMSTIVDLSERVAAQQQTNLKNAELAALNEELSHFAYSASHDLKAPLSSIAGLLSLCIEDLDSGNAEDITRNLEKAFQISRRSAMKVEGVLKIARAGRETLPRETINLDQMIKDIWQDLIGAKTDTALILSLDPGATIVTESPTLAVILENILSNAVRYIDYGKESHEISITSKSLTDGVSIAIKDNGIGISAQNLTVIFQMFKRLDERSGDGLGLALVQKQIQRLGGTIEVQSTEGLSTTFTITLPPAGVIDA